jgi:hypothetical protein
MQSCNVVVTRFLLLSSSTSTRHVPTIPNLLLPRIRRGRNHAHLAHLDPHRERQRQHGARFASSDLRHAFRHRQRRHYRPRPRAYRVACYPTCCYNSHRDGVPMAGPMPVWPVWHVWPVWSHTVNVTVNKELHHRLVTFDIIFLAG